MINTPKFAMACGHVSTALYSDEEGAKQPVCMACNANPETRLASKKVVDLKGRQARCKICKKEAPSSIKLPFFAYQTKSGIDEFYDGCKGWD